MRYGLMVYRFDPDMLRAARAMVGWTQTDLATKSGTGLATVRRQEMDPNYAAQAGPHAAWALAFQAAGLELETDEAGAVRGIRRK